MKQVPAAVFHTINECNLYLPISYDDWRVCAVHVHHTTSTITGMQYCLNNLWKKLAGIKKVTNNSMCLTYTFIPHTSFPLSTSLTVSFAHKLQKSVCYRFLFVIGVLDVCALSVGVFSGVASIIGLPYCVYRVPTQFNMFLTMCKYWITGQMHYGHL
jgi:hypothetical protein